MEAVPRLPMISFDIKNSTEIVTFGQQLKPYIASFYNEDPDSYDNEIHSLEALRAAAVRPSIDVNGCQMLKKYYCQLHFLKSRFPMQDNQVCSVFFAWKDNYSKMVCSVPEIDYELMSILYNIGAVHSQLGAQDSRVNPEGMKMACTHFQCAAWAFQTARDVYLQMVNLILAPEIIQFMNLTCLAQAQECILEKSMLDNRKATIIAKVAVQVVDYYKQALAALKSTVDDGCFSDLLSSVICKDWNKYLNFKITYHKSIALLFQGQQAEELQKMGERVAFYQAAADQLNEACKLASKLNLHQQEINEALAFTGDVVEGKKKAAKNENEFIYHEDVPEKDALQEVKGASLVKGIAFSVNDIEVSGPDIFGRLIPMEAHEASSLYSEEKAKLLRQMGELIEMKDHTLGEFMSSLQLDVLTQMRQASGLTQDLVDRAAAMSAKPNAVQDLAEAMGKLSNTYHDVEAMLGEMDSLLKEEEIKEQEYQTQMGKRPPSMLATDLTREYTKYKEAHSKASDSNENLHRAMTTHTINLKILALPLSQLKQQIPSIEFPNPEIDEDLIRELEALIGKVDEMKDQRALLWVQLRDGMKNDDITGLVVTKHPDKKIQELFKEEIKKHRKQAALLEQNMAAQENILKALVDTYAHFANTRRYIQDVITKRTTTLSALISSFDTYDDLLAKAHKGIEFYNKLETNVTKLLQRIKSTCNVQEEEREQMLSKHKTPKSVDVISNAPKLKDYLDKTITNKTLDSSNVTGVSNTSEQIWPPAIRPAPVGSEMTTDTYSTLGVEQAFLSNPNQAYYNQAVFTTANSVPPTNMAYNNYAYMQQQYPVDNTDQELSERMVALMSGRMGQDASQQNVISSQAYGYGGNYTHPQMLPPQNMYYPTENYLNQAIPTSQYTNTTSTVPDIQPYPADYSYQTGGFMPQTLNEYVSSYNQQLSASSTNGSYGYTPFGIQSPNSYSQANGNACMQTVPASYNYCQTATGISTPNVAPTEYNYGQSNTQAIQSPYSYTQASNDSQPQSIQSSNNTYAQSTSIQPSQLYYDPNNIQLTNLQQVYYDQNAYSAANNYMDPYINSQQDYSMMYHPGGVVESAGYQIPGHLPQNTNVPNNTSGMTNLNKEKSNLDLLSGLDFSVNQVPLMPQQNNSETPLKDVVPCAPKPNLDQPVITPTKTSISPPPPSTYICSTPLLQFRKDALQNSNNFKQLDLEVERYEKFVDILNTKTLNGSTNLDLKWKEIQDKLELDHHKSISVARCCPIKNRFPDILPYDQTRVKLCSMKDDYINATIFKNLTLNSPNYIITQAPLPSTFLDFWTLIWEQQIQLILCLLNDIELSNDIYWPQRDKTLSYKSFTISLQSTSLTENWTERIICIQHVEQRTSLNIRHLQFTAWPGSIFPTSHVPTINYINEILKDEKNLCRPVLIHCLAGIGRSGLFCLLLSAIIEVSVNPTVLPDLSSIAVNLSNTRKNVIRDREHLKFAYQAFLYFLKELYNTWRLKQPLQSSSSIEAIPNPSTTTNIAKDPLDMLDPLWASKRNV